MVNASKSVCTHDILFCIYIKSYSCKTVLEVIENEIIPMSLHKSGICYKLAILVDHDRTSRNLILHFYMLHISCILYCKLNIGCFQVSVWSKLLTKCVSLANYKLLDYMSFLCIRCPCVYHISILIKYSKCCTTKLCATCNIRLCKFKGCRSIFILAAIYSSFHILSLILGIKGYYLFVCHISGRLFNLFCNILCKRIILNKSNLSVFIRSCFLKECTLFDDYLAIHILDVLICIESEYSTCNRCVVL